MITIDAQQAIESLRHIVQAKGPEFVYSSPAGSSCVYAYDGQPSCGVGQALAHLGVPLAVVAELDTANCGTGISALSMATPLHHHGVHVTPQAARVFSQFQVVQDRGNYSSPTATWRLALQVAEAEFKNLEA